MIMIFEAMGFVAISFAIMATVICYSFVKLNTNNETSKYVMNYFEADNNTPELTELIEHHKTSNRKVKYKIAK